MSSKKKLQCLFSTASTQESPNMTGMLRMNLIRQNKNGKDSNQLASEEAS